MKIIKFLCIPIILMLLLSACGTKLNEAIVLSDVLAASSTANDITASEYSLITENDNLEFWFNENTTAFKVVDKSNGYEWYSTEEITQSNTENNAPFKLSYVNQSGLIETMDAMTASISDGQYSFQKTDNGIKVNYSLGEYISKRIIPLAMSKERKEFLLSNIESDFKKSQFDIMYQFINLEKLNDTNKEKFLALYPKLEEGPLYILRENVTASEDKMKELEKFLKDAGYTEEMYKQDSEKFVTDESETEEKPQFRVQIVYELTENGLKVIVPYKEIQMNASFPLLELELLKYFGSPDRGNLGYFLLPDGSGSLMNFYNGRGDLQEYSVNMYGTDYSAADPENIYQCDQAYFPVYGIKNGENAVFAVIEKGDAISTVKAYPGNEQLSAYAYPIFRIRSYAKSFLNSSANTNTSKSGYFVSLQNERYQDDIVVNYQFLNGEDATYKGMAKCYKQYLFGDANKITPKTPSLLVECVGQIEKVKTFAGFGYSKDIVLTDFNKVKNIADELSSAGIKDLEIKLSGWSNGPLRNYYANNISINKKMGSKSQLIDLAKYLSQKSIGFYPETDLLYTYETGLFDGYSTSRDSVTLVSKSKGYKIEYNPATFCRDPKYIKPAYINNIGAIESAFDGFFKDYSSLKINSVSLKNIGHDLNGDYDDKNGTDRQETADRIERALKKTAENYTLMTNGVNAYILKYADYCSDVPLWSNERDNTDESVPFVQMVISGNINYSGYAVNLSGDSKNNFLKMAAVAADVYYVVSGDNHTEVRDSEYDYLYNTDYSYLKDDIISSVNEYCKAMEGLSGQEIIDYARLDEGLYRTTFKDGSTVTVNYDKNSKIYDKVTYNAESYTVKRQEG